MLLISLSQPGSKPDLEGLYPNTTVAHLRVHSQAMIRLLVRLMEYSRRIGRRLHILIGSLIYPNTHYKTTLFIKNHRAFLRFRTSLQLRAHAPSSVKNVLSLFQSDIFWTSIWRNTIHHSDVMTAIKLFNIKKIWGVIAQPSTQRQLRRLQCYFVLTQDANSLQREVPAPPDETI